MHNSRDSPAASLVLMSFLSSVASSLPASCCRTWRLELTASRDSTSVAYDASCHRYLSFSAPLSLLPSELSQLGNDLLGALLFVANIVFWLDSGYFSSGSEAKLLLHTWSLGIEEQFYIFAPVIFLLLTRHARRHLTWLLAAALAASLLACVLLTRSSASTAFFLLPTRAWELLAGALLAVAMRSESGAVRLGTRFNQALALAGLMLVVLPVFFYSKATSFPGYAALAPVVGAVLVIAYSEGTLVGRLLSSRAVVFVGLISYSLYLWHWPLVVLFRNAGWLIPGPGVSPSFQCLFSWHGSHGDV
jgi:peptidoglycan/LPS O-acetylase OafA/YrhL